MRIDALLGSFKVAGTPIGFGVAVGWPTLRRRDRRADRGRVARCVHMGFERTSTQDVGFGLRQLTDVANKALSPGINDPTTAIHALGHISGFLCDLTGRDLGPKMLRDQDGRIRVVLRRPDLASFVDLGISQPRRYGAEDPQVLEKIFHVLLDLSHHVSPDQRLVVREQLRRLRATTSAQALDPEERAGLDLLGRRIEANLDGTRSRGDAGSPLSS